MASVSLGARPHPTDTDEAQAKMDEDRYTRHPLER